MMTHGSITSKLEGIVFGAIVLMGVFMGVLTEGRLKDIVDRSQHGIYVEKLGNIWNSLVHVNDRLALTGMVDAYQSDFIQSTLHSLEKTYYRDASLPIAPMILNRQGLVLMHPTLPPGDKSFKNNATIESFEQAESGKFVAVRNGQEKWYVYRHFEPWDWIIAYEIPLSVKYADVYAFRNTLWVIIAGSGALAVLVMSLVLMRITKPIVMLTRHSSKIASGDLEHAIDARGRDEIGTLARSFDHMRHSIKQRIAELNSEIDERKRAEELLQQSEDHLRITLNSLREGVVSTDVNGRIIRMNPAAETFSGWTFVEAKGHRLDEVLSIVHVSTRKPRANPVDRLLAIGEVEGLSEPSLLVSRVGTERLIAESGVPIRSDQGEMLGMVMVFRDITMEVELQERLRQSSKMDAIGQLAGGVAHDFNNMLGGILGAAELLEDYLPADPQAEKCHAIVTKSASRAAGLTQKLLSFARKQPAASTVISAHESVTDAVALLESTMDRRIFLEVDLRALEHQVVGDSSQLQNTFLNLGINAAQAMPDGGTIRISSANMHLSQKNRQQGHFTLEPGAYLVVECSDTGPGIAAADLPHLFEPFFTTKEQGEGTGLGLAAVFGTVQQHCGAVTVANNPVRGATFRVVLPLADKGIDLQKKAESSARKGTGTILVVEDEEIMRSTVKMTLERLGYSVLLAENGKQALDRFSEDPSAIDVVLLDMIMPVMNGRDCFAAMKNIDPTVRAILTSGFTYGDDIEQMKSAGLSGCLSKPYRGAELSQLLHSVLNP